ncbi:helix-hairpin-helix domain-containing protein [Streptomyces sp. NPDC051219]|uniref:helix-hairpin-helix domain-containing protein n=1 Tax=Streptomyces sp. NPDC051219 TaxID=3155283 RepID=UPI003430A636
MSTEREAAAAGGEPGEAARDGGRPAGTGDDPAEAGSTTQDGEGTPEDATAPGGENPRREQNAAEEDGGGAAPKGQDAAGDAGSAEEEGGAQAGGSTGEAGGDAGAVGQLSEAEAELAAQKALRERIEQRKAERGAPVEVGAKLSGPAADLLAAVRAVESGEKPPAAYSEASSPVERRPAAPVTAPPQVRPEATAAAGPGPVEAVRDVLAEGGAPTALAPQVAAALGDGAAQVLRENPWQLLGVSGVRPTQADGFARALLGTECGPGDERRTTALVGWLLEQAAAKGHTALESSVLTGALAQYTVPDPDEALHTAIADGSVLVFQDALEPTSPAQPATDDSGDETQQPVRVLIGLERYALAEESLADGLARLGSLLGAASADVGGTQGATPAQWEGAASAAPSPSAAELIRAVAGSGLVTHTGGEAARAEPAVLVAAARALGLRACAAAHTGDGQRRLAAAVAAASGGTGAWDPAALPAPTAVTVAGLLSGTEGPGRDAEGAFALDLLVVLDAPQLDVETAAAVVESVPDGARLVLSGDPGVLWSAGPGRVFADLLAARACPQVTSRTPDPGPLGELVSGVGIGELGQVDAPGKEVVIVPVRDAGEAVHRTVQLVADSVPRAIGVPPEGTRVITPGHGGSAGTRALNAALKDRLNPGPGRFGGFDPGDRVAYAQMPGRTLSGTVVTADAEGLHLDCGGAAVVVPKERVGTAVRHGWALTAHQAVGTRWPAVVVVLPGDAAQALSRDWVYTAFGRGERHLSVVHGVDQALPKAVAEILPKDRTTRLRTLLTTQAPSRTGARPGAAEE